jgi:hypothetical protein
MSDVGAAANADEKSGGDECCGMLMLSTAVTLCLLVCDGFEKLDADDTRRTKNSKVQRFMMLHDIALRSAKRDGAVDPTTMLRSTTVVHNNMHG